MSEDLIDPILEENLSLMRGIEPPASSVDYLRHLKSKMRERHDRHEIITGLSAVVVLTLLLAANGWLLNNPGQTETDDSQEIAIWYGQFDTDIYEQ